LNSRRSSAGWIALWVRGLLWIWRFPF
jgi:hypothetical protein